MKLFYLFSVLSLQLVPHFAFAKSMNCGFEVGSVGRGQRGKNIAMNIFESGRGIDSSFTVDQQKVRVIVWPWHNGDFTYNDSLYQMYVAILDEDTDEPIVYLKDFYATRKSGTDLEYVSLNHPSGGALTLTPRCIGAIKTLGRWGQPPFDNVTLDNEIADRNLMKSNVLDASYFFDNGGITIAKEAVARSLVSVNEILWLGVGPTCRITN